MKDKREADAVTAALERRRIAKRQAAARAERKRKAAISIALNEERKQQLKVCMPRWLFRGVVPLEGSSRS